MNQPTLDQSTPVERAIRELLGVINTNNPTPCIGIVVGIVYDDGRNVIVPVLDGSVSCTSDEGDTVNPLIGLLEEVRDGIDKYAKQEGS